MSDRNILNMEDDIVIFDTSQEQISAIVDKIIEKTSEEELKIALIDVLGRFDCFTDNPHLLGKPIRDPEIQERFFVWLNEEIRDRLGKVASAGVKSLDLYNEMQEDITLPFILIVIHEIKDMELSKNSEMIKAMLNDDNAGVYFLAFSKESKEDADLGIDMNMFKSMSYSDFERLISGSSPTGGDVETTTETEEK